MKLHSARLIRLKRYLLVIIDTDRFLYIIFALCNHPTIQMFNKKNLGKSWLDISVLAITQGGRQGLPCRFVRTGHIYLVTKLSKLKKLKLPCNTHRVNNSNMIIATNSWFCTILIYYSYLFIYLFIFFYA